MRKIFALSTATLLLASVSTAQDDGGSVRFGLKLAPNMGWIKPDTKGLKKGAAKFGYTFGLMSDFMVGGKNQYAFSTGVYLNNINGTLVTPTVNLAGDSKDLETDIHLRYIEVPITMKMKTSEIGYMTYYGQIGVSAGFNIRAKADYETFDDNNQVVLVEDDDIIDDVSLFKAALVVGGGFEYNFSGNTSLLVGITYNGGFTNLYDGLEYTDENGKTQKVKAFGNYLELTTGVFF